MTVSIEQLNAADKACRKEDYEGYAEFQFIQAFDFLCETAGGYRNGKKLAEKLIKEQVQ